MHFKAGTVVNENRIIIIIIIICWYQIFCTKLATDSTLPQLTVHSHNSIHSCCAANLILTKLKSSPLREILIQLTTFTNCLINAQLILTASKVWEFLGYCILYWSLKMLWLIHALTYCSCTVGCLLLLYVILFRSKLEYTLPACNITTANGSKPECSQWQFAALSLSQFFSHIPYNYAVALELLQLHAVQVTRYHFDATYLLFMFFQDVNFVLPWLITVVSEFLLVILEISPSFLQNITIALPLTYLFHGAESFLRSWLVLQLVKKFPTFLEPEGSSPYSQVPITCPYPEPTPSSPHNPLPLPEDPSEYYPPLLPFHYVL